MHTLADKPGVFMTATDTGAGKTTITAALILALRRTGQPVGVMKPIETGIDPQGHMHSDTDRLRSLLSPSPPFDSVCLYAFPQPLAPLACARNGGTIIDVPRIVSYVHHLTQQQAFVIVEGAGGIFTPITPQQTMRDLMAALRFPALVVGRTTLGGVNHLFLTLEALQYAGIKTSGIVLNDPISHTPNDHARQQQISTIELIRELSTVPVFGPVEFQETVGTHWRKGVETLADHPEIQRLARHLIERVS
jgi:dethiobiotin synthetase